MTRIAQGGALRISVEPLRGVQICGCDDACAQGGGSTRYVKALSSVMSDCVSVPIVCVFHYMSGVWIGQICEDAQGCEFCGTCTSSAQGGGGDHSCEN